MDHDQLRQRQEFIWRALQLGWTVKKESEDVYSFRKETQEEVRYDFQGDFWRAVLDTLLGQHRAP
jgi:hypothetical protein